MVDAAALGSAALRLSGNRRAFPERVRRRCEDRAPDDSGSGEIYVVSLRTGQTCPTRRKRRLTRQPVPARQRVDPKHVRLPIVSSVRYVDDKKNYS